MAAQHDEAKLGHRAALGLQIDRFRVEQTAADRHHDQAAANHARAALDVTLLLANQNNALRDPVVATLMHFTLAYYQARIGEFDAAIENVTASLAVARATGASGRNYATLAVGVMAALSKGDLVGAATMLKEMVEESPVATGFARVFYHTLAAWHAGQTCGG
jgi:hypothetical protein